MIFRVSIGMKKRIHFLLTLSGVLKSEPTMLPGRHALNAGLLTGNVGAMGYYLATNEMASGLGMLGTTTALSSVMGVTLTMAIGGNSEVF